MFLPFFFPLLSLFQGEEAAGLDLELRLSPNYWESWVSQLEPSSSAATLNEKKLSDSYHVFWNA